MLNTGVTILVVGGGVISRSVENGETITWLRNTLYHQSMTTNSTIPIKKVTKNQSSQGQTRLILNLVVKRNEVRPIGCWAQFCILHTSHMVTCRWHWRQICMVNLPGLPRRARKESYHKCTDSLWIYGEWYIIDVHNTRPQTGPLLRQPPTAARTRTIAQHVCTDDDRQCSTSESWLLAALRIKLHYLKPPSW